ncbi:MAG: DUF2029 domain-containing protein [Solirubrobacteraceae bacterium]|nr:DUF2029 domain-containing protein [Solirubrobacteraceae bacterium]
MRSRTLLIALLALAVAFVASAWRTQLGDYVDLANDNNAAPTIAALVDGDWDRAAENMPAQGMTSILLRVPFAAAGGSDKLWVYRLGSFGCMLLLVALVVVLDRRMQEAGRPPLYRLAIGVAMLLGPIGLAPLHSGHPEEIVGGVLCVAAVLAATGGRAVWAGILLGLAVGTKQWALLAVPVVLVAVAGPNLFDRRRLIATGVAAAVGAATVLPGILANPDRYEQTTGHLASTKRTYAQSLWWPIATKKSLNLDLGGGERRQIDVFALPGSLDRGKVTGLAVIAAFALGAWALFRRGGIADPMGLLAFLMTLRCAVDPMNLDYYAAPALMAMAAWEASSRGPDRKLPVITLATSIIIWAAWRWPDDSPHALVFAFWLLSLLPLLLLRQPAGEGPAPQPA